MSKKKKKIKLGYGVGIITGGISFRYRARLRRLLHDRGRAIGREMQ